jgi:hypothetical protein
MSRTTVLAALLVIVSAHPALCQNAQKQLSNGLSAAGAAADPAAGNDRWGDDRWRDDHWRDDQWRDNPWRDNPGNAVAVPSGRGGIAIGNTGIDGPGVNNVQGALKVQPNVDGIQGNITGTLNSNVPVQAPFAIPDGDRRYSPDNFNNFPDANIVNANDIAKGLSGQGGTIPGR